MIGNQTPRIKIEPDRIATNGDGAILLYEKYGNTLDEWQKNILKCWLGTDQNGKYTMTSGGLSVSRQNGKNCILLARELYGLVVGGEKIIHSAHQVRTAKRQFQKAVALFTDKTHPELGDMVENIRFTNGEEAITLKNGASIEFCSRSKQTARGYDGISLIVMDEAQEVLEEQIEALLATVSASTSGVRQIIYVGTPPYPNCLGTVFSRFREKVIQEDKDGTNKANAWHEWSVEADSIDKINAEDRELWYQCNPAMGLRLTEEFTEEEYKSLSLDGFCRERLGFWVKPRTQQIDYVIDVKKWELCKSDERKPDGKTAYGVKFSADGAEVCLCGAVIGKDGIARIELIERMPTGYGINWLVEWLNQRVKIGCCTVVDGRNGVDLLIDKLSETWKFKGSVIRTTSTIAISAVDMLMNEINEQTVTWYSKQDALNASATSAIRRTIGKGYGFGGEDCTPIEACALALYGVRTSKRNPQKKMRIG